MKNLIFILLLSAASIQAQTYLSQTKFNLGVIDSLNEDVIDINLSSQLAKDVFLLRIQAEKTVEIKYTSKNIKQGGGSLLRFKFKPLKSGNFKETVSLYFSNNLEPINLTFVGNFKSIPKNRLQSCPDFRAGRQAATALATFQSQSSREIQNYYVELLSIPPKIEVEHKLLPELTGTAAVEQLEDNSRNTRRSNAERRNRPPRKTPEERRNSPSIMQTLFGNEVNDSEPLNNSRADTTSIPAAEPALAETPIYDSLLGDEYKSNHIIFLIDASTSMREEDKMELLKQTMVSLLEPLREEDFLSIVTYSGEAEVLLAPTSGIEKDKIKIQINNIEADGSTQAVKGIQKALLIGKNHFIEGGNNQIILASDGAFNIGERNMSLRRRIEKNSEEGLSITVLGIKNARWTNKSLGEIAELGNGKLIHCRSARDTRKVLEEVKERARR